MVLLTKERIVETATDIVRNGGHEQLSLRGLAAALDVTAPAIYDHVASKDSVLRAVAAAGYEELRAALTSTAPTAIGRVRERAISYVEFARTHAELFRLMFMFRPDVIALDVDNELGAASEVFAAGLGDIAEAVADGALLDRDPVQLSLTLWAAVHGVATVSILAPGLAEAVVDDVVDAMLVGLRPAGSPG